MNTPIKSKRNLKPLTVAKALHLPAAQREYQREIEQLLIHVLEKNQAFLRTYPEYELSPEQTERFERYSQAVLEGTPLAYVLGMQAFWTLNLKVTPDTLIPRPDTEIVIETILKLLPKNKSLHVIDLGTGTGAIALSLAKECPAWMVTATDFSRAALAVARENAEAHGLNRVRFLLGSWFEAMPDTKQNAQNPKGSLTWQESFDLIVSNPPYIAADDVHLTHLRHEPISALVAEDHGLYDIKTIISQSVGRLNALGWLVLEHGHDQGQAVRDLMVYAGFNNVRTVQDYGQNDRVTLGRKAGQLAC